MEGNKKLRFNKEKATKLWTTHAMNTEEDYPFSWWRDEDGHYWLYIEKEDSAVLQSPAWLLTDLVWKYCAEAPRGNMWGSNDIVQWNSKEWDINKVISDITDRSAQLTQDFWDNQR